MLLLTVFVHRVDTEIHSSVPDGFRWAVHVGADPADLASCLNAGWAPDEFEAALTGETAAVVGKRVATLCGIDATTQTIVLSADPIPGGGDLLTIGG